MIISLGRLLPDGSCSLPGTRTGRAAPRSCLALLPAGVAWPPHCCGRRWSLTPPFHPYQSPGGMSLWPDPAAFTTPGITRRCALWSADFPRSLKRSRSSGQPGSTSIYREEVFPSNQVRQAGIISAIEYSPGGHRCENPWLPETGR